MITSPTAAVGDAFSRVALFAVDADALTGLAQLGLPRAGGPEDEDFREVRLQCGEVPAVRAALDAGTPSRAPLGEPGDHRLAVLLGNAIPAEAWLAPLREGPDGAPFALVYADNLPGGELIGDVILNGVPNTTMAGIGPHTRRDPRSGTRFLADVLGRLLGPALQHARPDQSGERQKPHARVGDARDGRAQ